MSACSVASNDASYWGVAGFEPWREQRLFGGTDISRDLSQFIQGNSGIFSENNLLLFPSKSFPFRHSLPLHHSTFLNKLA
jgi:hypothetical protein